MSYLYKAMKPKIKIKECSSCPYWTALKQAIAARELMMAQQTQKKVGDKPSTKLEKYQLN